MAKIKDELLVAVGIVEKCSLFLIVVFDASLTQVRMPWVDRKYASFITAAAKQWFPPALLPPVPRLRAGPEAHEVVIGGGVSSKGQAGVWGR